MCRIIYKNNHNIIYVLLIILIYTHLSYCIRVDLAEQLKLNNQLRSNRPRRINPYIEGPAPPEDIGCTRRNGCLDRSHLTHRLSTMPIARQIGKGNLVGITYESGYPPDLLAPVSRWLTEIPPPPFYSKQVPKPGAPVREGLEGIEHGEAPADPED